jgi:hypothetical protein
VRIGLDRAAASGGGVSPMSSKAKPAPKLPKTSGTSRSVAGAERAAHGRRGPGQFVEIGPAHDHPVPGEHRAVVPGIAALARHVGAASG